MGDNQERRANVRRVQLGDGDLPAFEVTSPCYGKPSLITAWMINAARANTAGRLLIEPQNVKRYGPRLQQRSHRLK